MKDVMTEQGRRGEVILLNLRQKKTELSGKKVCFPNNIACHFLLLALSDLPRFLGGLEAVCLLFARVEVEPLSLATR